MFLEIELEAKTNQAITHRLRTVTEQTATKTENRKTKRYKYVCA